MGASTRRRLLAMSSGLAAALLAANPVLARGDPPPPWGEPWLAAMAVAVIGISALLAPSVSDGHRRA